MNRQGQIETEMNGFPVTVHFEGAYTGGGRDEPPNIELELVDVLFEDGTTIGAICLTDETYDRLLEECYDRGRLEPMEYEP